MSFLKRLFGGQASRHFRHGIRAFEVGRYAEALESLERAMQCGKAPGDPIGHLAVFYAAEASTYLGRAALEDCAPREALRWLEPALEWNPRSPSLLELASTAYLETGLLDDCACCIEALQALDPERLGTRILAALLSAARQDAQAIRSHIEALRARPLQGVVPRALTRILESRLADSPEFAPVLQDIVCSPEVSQV